MYNIFDWLWPKKTGSKIGIDLGSSAIKMVELEKKDERLFLSNYALFQTPSDNPFRISDLKDEEIVGLLKRMIQEAQIKSRRASISLPVEKTFSIAIELPMMAEKELAAAIPFEARKYIPVPLDEIVLDWSILDNKQNKDFSKVPKALTPLPKAVDQKVSAAVENLSEKINKEKEKIKEAAGPPQEKKMQVLVVAVPKEVINRLTKIAKAAELELESLEQESFSLVRAILGNEKNTYVLADLGRRSTDLIIADEGMVRSSHNLETINKEIVLMEIDRLINNFQVKYNKKISQCLLVGGRSGERDFVEFLKNKLKLPVRVADPLARVGYDPALKKILPEITPSLAVAVGLAMQ